MIAVFTIFVQVLPFFLYHFKIEYGLFYKDNIQTACCFRNLFCSRYVDYFLRWLHEKVISRRSLRVY